MADTIALDLRELDGAVEELRRDLVRPQWLAVAVGQAMKKAKAEIARAISTDLGVPVARVRGRIRVGVHKARNERSLFITVGGDRVSLTHWRLKEKRGVGVAAKARRGGGSKHFPRGFVMPTRFNPNGVLFSRDGNDVTAPLLEGGAHTPFLSAGPPIVARRLGGAIKAYFARVERQSQRGKYSG